MRILTSRIYRAFPELDRYGDEQCLRFLHAAKRGTLRRVWHAGVIFFIGTASLLASLAGVGWLATLSSGGPDNIGTHRPWHLALFLTLLLVATAVGPVAGFLTRDVLLRRRVRFVLRTRGVCSGCRYSLVGLGVSDQNIVTCPECGLTSEVDPSLGELVTDEEGRKSFKPAEQAGRAPRFFTPRRVRIIKRTAKWSAITLAVAIPAGFGGYELFLRYQASKARSLRPGPEALLALIEKSQPPGIEGMPDAWSVFNTAVIMLEEVDARLWRSKNTGGPDDVHPEFVYLYAAPNPEMSEHELAKAAKQKELARSLISAYRDAGLFTEMERMSKCPRAVRPIGIAGTQSLMDMRTPELSKSRAFARLNAARMAVAAERGDLAEFISAAEANFALVRMVASQRLLIDHLVGSAIEVLTYARLRALLASHPSREWLDAIDGAIARQRIETLIADIVEGNRIGNQDFVAWMFSDPSKVRWGRFSKSVRAFYGSDEWPTAPLGTFAANRAEIDAAANATAEHFAREPFARRELPELLTRDSDLLLPSMMTVGNNAWSGMDNVELERRGYLVMAALERCFADRGEYPESLLDLVPAYVKTLPIDPWSGKGFGYVRIEAASDPQQRGYLLYSTGTDGKDNGGHWPHQFRQYVASKTPEGSDFIINDEER